jgi:hypothetical protein
VAWLLPWLGWRGAVLVLTGTLLVVVLSRMWRCRTMALFGAANGLITMVRGGLVPKVFGRAQVGRIGGAMSAIGLLARAAAPVAAALLLALGSYREMALLLAALGVVAVLSFLAARRRH